MVPTRRAAVALAIAFGVAAAAFLIWPILDLRVAALFYRPDTGFWLGALPGVEPFRNFIWDLTILTFVVAIVGAGLALAGRPLLGVPLRDWVYVALLYFLGPILVTNILLKAHWGRARPADVTDFGGPHLFTPPWQPADQCSANCSFVSGEVSATVVMGIAMLVIAPALARHLPRIAMRFWRAAAYALPLVIAAQRVMTGRHFLSDAVFAALFMLALALALLPVRSRAPTPRR